MAVMDFMSNQEKITAREEDLRSAMNSPIDYDLARMKSSLEGPSYMLAPSMSLEEMRQHILATARAAK